MLQVEHEKQLTHQALFRAETTEGSQRKRMELRSERTWIAITLPNEGVDTHHRPRSHGCSGSTRHQTAAPQRDKVSVSLPKTPCSP